MFYDFSGSFELRIPMFCFVGMILNSFTNLRKHQLRLDYQAIRSTVQTQPLKKIPILELSFL